MHSQLSQLYSSEKKNTHIILFIIHSHQSFLDVSFQHFSQMKDLVLICSQSSTIALQFQGKNIEMFYHICRPRWLSWMHVRLMIRRLHVSAPPGRQHSFMEIDHEIFSTVLLSLPLIQKGQLSVSGERMWTILVNRLED